MDYDTWLQSGDPAEQDGELIAYQDDVHGQASNDLFLAQQADRLLGTVSYWQDEVANAPEFGHDITTEIADALAEIGVVVIWDNGVLIYQ